MPSKQKLGLFKKKKFHRWLIWKNILSQNVLLITKLTWFYLKNGLLNLQLQVQILYVFNACHYWILNLQLKLFSQKSILFCSPELEIPQTILPNLSYIIEYVNGR